MQHKSHQQQVAEVQVTGKLAAPSARHVQPDAGERARRMPDLLASHALPIADFALCIGVPLSTVDMLRAKGQGPITFKIGRRLYVRQKDMRDWLDKLACAAGGV